jgi:hypothetical protein
MTQNVSGWLPNLIGPVVIQGNASTVPARPTLNFVGLTVTDNPGAARTDITAAALASLSSSQLATALTDETGTGLAVFNTAPLFQTTINLNNPGNTFKYVVTPAAIAADRTLTLPLLASNDTAVCEAFAQSLTNKTIVAASNTITDTSAATGDILRHNGTRFVRLARGTANQVLQTNAGATDIAWATVAAGASAGGSGQVQASDGAGAFIAATNVIAGTSGGGFVSIGATPAGTGNLRLPNAAGVSARNSGNSADYSLLVLDASNYVTVGDAAGGSYYQSQQGGNDTIIAQTSNGIVIRIVSALINVNLPICGGANAYGAVDGQAVVAVSTTNITLSAAQYSRRTQKYTGAPAAARTITYPAPSDDDHSYEKIVWCQQTVSSLVISTGTGTTVTIVVSSAPHVLWFSPAGVVQIT